MKNIKKLIEQILPEAVRGLITDVGNIADESGVRVFLVGGIVRDLFLGKRNLDIDIAVEGDAIRFAETVKSKIPGKLTVYKKFGTATLLLGEGARIDLACTRKESYSSVAAMPEVRPGSIEEDLSRRDFTINAIAVNINKQDFGSFVDLCGGEQDIKAGIIRVLHDNSFIDDPTRIFRAVKFEKRLSFHLEKKTEKLILQAIKMGVLEKIEMRRISAEEDLISKEEKAESILLRLDEWGVTKDNIKERLI